MWIGSPLSPLTKKAHGLLDEKGGARYIQTERRPSGKDDKL